ncbi:MAG: helix-turn-helix domain-containing protein [Candidatus Eremiobacteraeota bacterium]|nr:helix-turn-helix domain-containing protein [Candidatus Eremiobacteraeota bacterium]
MEDEARAFGSPDFGALLRRYRVAAGLSQEGLAERARLSASGVGALERGDRRTPQRETLALLSDALTLSPEQRREFALVAARSAPARRQSVGSVTRGPWPTADRSGLPRPLTSFVGRSADLAEVAALTSEHRLVTLTGAGGIGKTRLALEVAIALNSADNPVWFGALAPVGEAGFVIPAIASAIGVQGVPHRELLETVLAYLKNKTRLLILDNCEHLIAEAARTVASLLAGTEYVHVLATSREPLRVAGERIYRLRSLNVPDAVALFSDRAQAADHHFALTDQNAASVAEICQRLDGIPLAIELAAARTNVLTAATLAEMLEHRFKILVSAERAASPRQQTMRATIDWSYNLLSAPEQRVFERLSVFAGGCTLGAAAAVCAGEDVGEDEVLDLLSSLVDKSLVVPELDGDQSRYRLLESFQRFARERLAARGEVEIAARRHASALLERVTQLDSDCDNESHDVWHALVREELDNWRAALRWALTDRNDVILGQQLVARLTVAWQYFAPFEGRRWIGLALSTVDDRAPPRILADLLCAEAIVASQLCDRVVPLDSAQRALAQCRISGDVLGAARAQSIAGHALAGQGRVPEAEATLLDALAAARERCHRRLTAYILRYLGYASAVGGNVVAARTYLAEALSLFEALGAKLAAARVTDDLGEYEFRAGNAELALRYAFNAVSVFRAYDCTRDVVYGLSSMSGYLVSLGRYEEAEERAREALELARENQLELIAAGALRQLAAIAVLRPRAGVGQSPTSYETAAKIVGFADTRLAARAAPAVQNRHQERDRVVEALHDAMGADAVANLMADGAAMTQTHAVEEALANFW